MFSDQICLEGYLLSCEIVNMLEPVAASLKWQYRTRSISLEVQIHLYVFLYTAECLVPVRRSSISGTVSVDRALKAPILSSDCARRLVCLFPSRNFADNIADSS